MPVAAVDPKEVGGVEGVDEGGVEHELRLQVVQEVVSKGWLRRVEEGWGGLRRVEEGCICGWLRRVVAAGWLRRVVAVTQCRRGEGKQ
jgi:hypothetical protein